MEKAPTIPGGLLLPSGELTPGLRHRRLLAKRNATVARGLEVSGKRVLNVGCAEGLHSLYMAEFAEEVVSIDHEKHQIEGAKATAELLGFENTRFHVADVRDSDLYKRLGKFDLVIAWGLLHRVADIFSLLYRLEPLSENISLEWRHPVIPGMSRLSWAYHYPDGDSLDPLNVRRGSKSQSSAKKIEGKVGFWEPTPGAVVSIMRRIDYSFSTLIGFGEDLVSERKLLTQLGDRLVRYAIQGEPQTKPLSTRVHMTFGKKENIMLRPRDEIVYPDWDVALLKAFGKPSVWA